MGNAFRFLGLFACLTANAEAASAETQSNLDIIWILVSAALAFLMQAIIEHGDLTRRVEVGIGTEAGEIARSFNTMRGQFEHNIKSMIETVHKLNDTAETLGAVTGETRNGMDKQMQGATIITDSMDQLARTVEEATNSIENVIDASVKADTGAASSHPAVEMSLGSIGALSETVGQETATKSAVQAEMAGEALNIIVDSVRTIGAYNKQITTALNAHRQLAGHIQHSVRDIREVAESTASGVQRTTDQGQALSDITGNLQQLVDQHKVIH